MNDLQDAGIHKGEMAPAIQGLAAKLERQMHTDTVAHLLESRPDPEDLEDAGILKDDWVAPSLQGKRAILEKKITQDRLSGALKDRPTRWEVEVAGVFEEPTEEEMYADYQQEEAEMYAAAEAEYEQARGVFPGVEEEEPQYEQANAMQLNRTLRARYGMALKGAARLYERNLISADMKAALKDLILDDDGRVMAAIEVFELDLDAEEMLDTLHRIAKRAVM
jgi:hypothetical protein